MSRKKWPGSGGGDRVVKTRQSHTTARVKRGKFDGIFQKEVRARDVFATPRTGPSRHAVQRQFFKIFQAMLNFSDVTAAVFDLFLKQISLLLYMNWASGLHAA